MDGVDDIEPDLPINTPNSFEKVRFFELTGDIRPEFEFKLSFVDCVVILRILSLRELLCSVSFVESTELCLLDRLFKSFFNSSCFKRCLCSATRNFKLGDSIAAFIALSNNVRK